MRSTPTLHPLKNSGPVLEPAIVVNGVPPEDEAELLVSEPPGAAVFGDQVLGTPAGDLPTEGPLWQEPGAVVVTSPGGTEVDGFEEVDLLCGEG